MTLGDDDASEDKLVQSLIGEAVKSVFDRVAEIGDYDDVIENFQKNVTFPGGDEITGSGIRREYAGAQTAAQAGRDALAQRAGLESAVTTATWRASASSCSKGST